MKNYKLEIEAFRLNHKEMSMEINGANFRYWFYGKGEFTYILLPGGMGCGEFFYNHILVLEKHNKVLTLEYPLELKDNISVADGIIALIDSLKIEKAIFIGQSYGGMIAQVIAKRHTAKVFGLILSNTGTISETITPSDKKLKKMIFGQKIGLSIGKILPYSWVKKAMLKKMNNYLKTIDAKYQQYIQDVFKAMIEGYPRERYNLMTKLLLDFHTKQRFTTDDFKTLKNKQLLIFSPTDQTFSEDVRDELIALMPNPVVNRSLKSGHVAIIIEIDEYINIIRQFSQKELFIQ